MGESWLFGMSGEEIYRNFTEAVGGGDLASAGDIARELQAEHEDEAREIRALAVLMESAWRGDAAGAAQRGAAPLAVEHEASAPLLFTDHDLFHRQVGSFGDARNRVVPVPPAPDRPPGIGILFQPGPLPSYQRQLDAYNAAVQTNVDAMTSYEAASEYNRDNLPGSYGALAPDSAGVSVAPPDGGTGPHGGTRPRGGAGPEGRDTGGDARHPASGGPGPASTGGQPGPAGGGGPVDGPQQTTPGGYVPPATPVPVPGEGAPVGGGAGGGAPLPVGGFTPGRLGPPGAPEAGLGGRGAGGPEAGPGARRGIGGPGAGGGPGSGVDAHPGGRGVGGRTGSGPLAGGTTVEAAARGSAGARGGAGAGEVPAGAGAGRARDAEDEEHRRKVLLEGGDPEDLFGSDELTAPPVIGEDED